jgi:chorismate mutase/prephenate dehydratase
MTTSTSALDDLRRRIDQIDDQLHDLIMQRAEVVESVARAKKRGGIATVRPGREATLLRRLIQRHRGRFPRAVLVRLWRELISGAVSLQGEFSVAVYAPGAMADYWDMARDHYGSHMPMLAFHSATEVLRALSEGRAAVGVLPMPAEGERAPWWPLLTASGATAPRIIARLPFAGRGNARGENVDALVVGQAEFDSTGDDRSFLALEIEGDLSRARLIGALKEAGLAVTLITAHSASGASAWNLVEIDDLVTADDARLKKALTPLAERVTRVVHLGAYARPLTAAALAGGA